MSEFVYEQKIDPRNLFVADKPKRRRRPKNREYAPVPEFVRPWIEAAIKRKDGRPCQPGVMFEVEAGPDQDATRLKLVSPYGDEDAMNYTIADAFGTRSYSVMMVFLSHLSELMPSAWDADNCIWRPDERSLNAALSIVHSSRPKDEVDAMLCAQAVALHWMQMRAARSTLSNSETWVNDKTAATCAKLSKAFVTTVEAMDRRKRKAPRKVKQEIKVTRETHYHTHKHIHLEGGSSDYRCQPQATEGQLVEYSTGGAGECAALPSSCTNDRESVPITGGKKQAGL